MTVKELIEKLDGMPPDAVVVYTTAAPNIRYKHKNGLVDVVNLTQHHSVLDHGHTVGLVFPFERLSK